ncbi:MAG: hypothetical protein WA001_04620 [Patescibacteria group bacterium]
MQLPEHLQHFPHPALILVSDSVKAKFFLAGGDSLQELDGVFVPRGNEKTEPSPDGKRIAGFDADVDDGPRLHDFIHQLVAKTDALVKQHGIAHIHLVMPAEVEHQFSGHLPKEDKEKIGQTLHHDLMNEDPLKIIERLLND